MELVKSCSTKVRVTESIVYKTGKAALLFTAICSATYISLNTFKYIKDSYNTNDLYINELQKPRNIVIDNKPQTNSIENTLPIQDEVISLDDNLKSGIKNNTKEKKLATISNIQYEENKAKMCKQLGISPEEFDRRIESGEGVSIAYIPQQQSDAIDIYTNNFLKEYSVKHVNLFDLQAKNPDVIGWIKIPILEIDEPVVISKQDDYNYYLQHDILNKQSAAGSVELDYLSNRNTIGIGSNSIFYGHNMLNGDKFGRLKSLLNKNIQDKAGSDLIEYMTSDNSGMLFKIVSVFITDENDYFYKSVYLNLNDQNTYKSFSDSIMNRNIISKFNDSGTNGNGFISLSTCYGVGDSKRLVVVAKPISVIYAN